jgi:hypothetical protein
MIYAMIGFNQRASLGKLEPDANPAAGLTLAGFCFTSLSLLVSFFSEAIQREESGPENMILFFCCALFCFIASYMALRYPAKKVLGFMSYALIDNGFWCILVGLLTYFTRSRGMRKPAIAVSALLVFYAGYLILQFRHPVRYEGDQGRR